MQWQRRQMGKSFIRQLIAAIEIQCMQWQRRQMGKSFICQPSAEAEIQSVQVSQRRQRCQSTIRQHSTFCKIYGMQVAHTYSELQVRVRILTGPGQELASHRQSKHLLQVSRSQTTPAHMPRPARLVLQLGPKQLTHAL